MGTVLQLAQTKLTQSVQSFFERVAERPWVVLVELLLIGSVVYAILRFLQGTRGARLVRALLTILAVSFAVVWLIAERFEFERINVLYPYFVFGVFLVSLVAFQSELRRIFLRVGQGGWLQRWIKGSGEIIDPIVAAAVRLSNKKIGALIALERTTEHGALIESGVRLDALITTELLETIFWPGTALHDLGVIVRQERIVAAGCQFPLAESEDVDRSLGSRHRAALGLSMEGDAVVIVVSEETGAISVAIGGKFQRSLTSKALAELLSETFASDTAEPAEDATSSADRETATKTEEDHRDGTGQAA